MKEILAVVRMNKMNDTKDALTRMGVNSLTARKVLGRGQGKVEYNVMHDGQRQVVHAISEPDADPRLIPKRMINVVVSDERVQDVIHAILDVNQTGHAGDGKIFVMPVLDAVRIRTGEINESAIDENNSL